MYIYSYMYALPQRRHGDLIRHYNRYKGCTEWRLVDPSYPMRQRAHACARKKPTALAVAAPDAAGEPMLAAVPPPPATATTVSSVAAAADAPKPKKNKAKKVAKSVAEALLTSTADATTVSSPLDMLPLATTMVSSPLDLGASAGGNDLGVLSGGGSCDSLMFDFGSLSPDISGTVEGCSRGSKRRRTQDAGEYSDAFGYEPSGFNLDYFAIPSYVHGSSFGLPNCVHGSGDQLAERFESSEIPNSPRRPTVRAVEDKGKTPMEDPLDYDTYFSDEFFLPESP